MPPRSRRKRWATATCSDGEICDRLPAGLPADAIVFGNINDPNSKVSKIKAQSRNYALMEN